MVVLNNIQITLLGWFYALKNQLAEKHHDVVENKWIIWVVVLIAVIGGLATRITVQAKGTLSPVRSGGTGLECGILA